MSGIGPIDLSLSSALWRSLPYDRAMSKVTYAVVTVVVAGIVFGLVACGSTGSQSTPTVVPASTSSQSTAASSSGGTPPEPISAYCSVEVPEGIRQQQIKAGKDVVLNTGWLGAGDTVAVLLHQTDGDGMCGFLFYAAYLAEHGVRVVLMDFCDYGQSDCGDAQTELTAQVQAVTDAVRDQGAKRVVLVGASLGGSVAVSAAKRTKADAIVDLSGPADFGKLSIADNARSITMPALFAFSDTDRSDLEEVRQNLKRMPAKTKIFLSYPAGHGYELLQDQNSGELNPLADRVQRFVTQES
jgi:dienelactone hydrolase